MGRPKKVVKSSADSQISEQVSAVAKRDGFEASDESREHDEFQVAKKKAESCDAVTEFVRAFHKNPNLQPIENFSDGRIPYLPDGKLLKVRLCYPVIRFIVDEFPADATQEDIDAKKWEFQRVGYRFSYIRTGETLECDANDPKKQELIRRADPLPFAPVNRIKFSTSDVGRLYRW